MSASPCAEDDGSEEARADAAVVRRVLAGDIEAYAEIVHRHRPRLERFALYMLHTPEDAEEAVQDAFVRAFRALGRYEERERFLTWLLRILANRCRTVRRQLRLRERRFVSNELAIERSPGHAPADQLVWDAELQQSLGRLPVDQREAILLKHADGLSYEEISQITGAGISTLKMRVQRGCRRLRDLLGEVTSV